ncbi:MAG: indole-3-glycerol-phosphate synthase [Solirubrobacterales bacterium]|nr:indole-3-glycerol-phosphate synthase [Solirubrobacterales bacterium]
MRRGLAGSIRTRQEAGVMPVLSEIKVRSPKDGDLLRGRDPEELATAMAGAGIAGLSIVTAPEDFDGDVEIVRRIRRRVDVPILRKDFTREVTDLDETVEAGADAILLTVALLDDETLGVLHDAAHARGLETLIETHSEAELARVGALGLQPDLLGINNRDIRRLERDDGDVSRTERLAAHVHENQLLLSESSIDGAQAVRRARKAGADAVLVGTWILTADDPAEAIETLISVGWPG